MWRRRGPRSMASKMTALRDRHLRCHGRFSASAGGSGPTFPNCLDGPRHENVSAGRPSATERPRAACPCAPTLSDCRGLCPHRLTPTKQTTRLGPVGHIVENANVRSAGANRATISACNAFEQLHTGSVISFGLDLQSQSRRARSSVTAAHRHRRAARASSRSSPRLLVGDAARGAANSEENVPASAFSGLRHPAAGSWAARAPRVLPRPLRPVRSWSVRVESLGGGASGRRTPGRGAGGPRMARRCVGG